jgi:hypothetical protein
MSIKVLNESLGCEDGKIEQNNLGFMKCPMSKINELFNMNKNEFCKKKQLSDYSHYLVNEIATTQKKLKAISKGDMSPRN